MKEEILQAFKDSSEVKARFIRNHADMLIQVVKVLVAAFKGGHKVLLFGNGGSAADAQHLAA
ncbi:MAG: SIS domain-containing protein, partial [Deltaproteobacteria bacterium]